MGSSNVACSVSRISLCPGMPVAYIPLKPYRFGPSPTQFRQTEEPYNLLIYPWALFEPLTLPIFGEYADYGQIDEIERNENVKHIEKYFKQSIDTITGTKQVSLHKIFCHGMFVHRDIYQHMIDNRMDEWGNTEGAFVTNRSYLNKEYTKLRKILIAKTTGSKLDKSMAALDQISRGGIFQFRDEESMAELYHSEILKGHLKKDLVDFILFEISMNYANVHFAPAMNGYQCGNPYGNKSLHQKIVKILDKRIKQDKEDRED